MIQINDTQGSIIEKFVENYTDSKGNILPGITSGMVEKFGIVPKTFRIHKDFLTKNYLIRLNRIEYHGMRNWLYYQITKYGALAYLKWISTKEKPTKATLNKLSFPLIGKYMVNIKKKYGMALRFMMEDTIEQIDVQPQTTLVYKGEEIPLKVLYVTMALQLGSIEVKFYQEHKLPDIIKTKNLKRDYLEIDDFSEQANEAIDNAIVERFTFLFFYNLIFLGRNVGVLTSIFLRSRPQLFNLEKFEKEKFEKDANRFEKRMKENSKYVLNLVKKDEELNSIFKKNLEEIISKMSKRESLDYLKKELKLISV